MKTKKLNLHNLKVESFITSLDGKLPATIKGRGGLTWTQTFSTKNPNPGTGNTIQSPGILNGIELLITKFEGGGQNGESGGVCIGSDASGYEINGACQDVSKTGCPGSDQSAYEINGACQ